MIILYDGTPGSGKSLHAVITINRYLKMDRPVLSNFSILHPVPKHKKGNKGGFLLVPNDKLNVDMLIRFSEEYRERIGKDRLPEDYILLVIDECQIIFNARDWKSAGEERAKWNSFFSQHRKLGYKIVLVTQLFDAIDKQIRALVEYTYHHRKLANISLFHKFYGLLRGGGTYFQVVSYYTPLEMKDSVFLIRGKESIYVLYKTFTLFKGWDREEQKGKPEKLVSQ